MSLVARSQKKDAHLVEFAWRKGFEKAWSATLMRTYMDSLSKMNRQGTVFVRFKVAKSGIIDIKCSSGTPPLLSEALGEMLRKVERSVFSSNKRKEYYVLPVEFDFLTNSAKKTTLAELLTQLPAITDYDFLLEASSPNKFNEFFDLGGTDPAFIYGIKCILLPTISISGKIL